MKKLPLIKGLLHAISATTARAVQCAKESRSQTMCPRSAHEAAVEAERCAVQVKKFEALLEDDLHIIFQINTICEFIEMQKEKTPHRQLALRCLETAEMHLRREIGDEPGKI